LTKDKQKTGILHYFVFSIQSVNVTLL